MYYVYGFFNEDWGVYFYIGSGTKERARLGERNKTVNAILSNWRCRSILLDSSKSRIETYQLEDYWKRELQDKGHPIIDGESATYNHRRAMHKGIAIAKEQGKYKGKPKMKINEKKFNDLYEEVKKGYISKTEMAERLNISRSTLYRRLKELERDKEDIK